MSSPLNSREIVWVSPELKKKLKLIKAEMDVKRIDEVIESLIDNKVDKKISRSPLWPRV